MEEKLEKELIEITEGQREEVKRFIDIVNKLVPLVKKSVASQIFIELERKKEFHVQIEKGGDWKRVDGTPMFITKQADYEAVKTQYGIVDG